MTICWTTSWKKPHLKTLMKKVSIFVEHETCSNQKTQINSWGGYMFRGFIGGNNYIFVTWMSGGCSQRVTISGAVADVTRPRRCVTFQPGPPVRKFGPQINSLLENHRKSFINRIFLANKSTSQGFLLLFFRKPCLFSCWKDMNAKMDKIATNISI